jgi:hypothetical protein
MWRVKAKSGTSFERAMKKRIAITLHCMLVFGALGVCTQIVARKSDCLENGRDIYT